MKQVNREAYLTAKYKHLISQEAREQAALYCEGENERSKKKLQQKAG